jgi:hypothetical protein
MKDAVHPVLLLIYGFAFQGVYIGIGWKMFF